LLEVILFKTREYYSFPSTKINHNGNVLAIKYEYLLTGGGARIKYQGGPPRVVELDFIFLEGNLFSTLKIRLVFNSVNVLGL